MTRAPFFSKAFRRHVPVLRQAEMTECGLACLAMVLAHYGAAVEIGVMRRQYPASARGTSLSGLATIAKNFGCETAGVRANLEELGALRMPCILHWNLNHFVVLVAVKKHAVVIHDPERGRVVVSMADASKAFTGGVLEIRPTAQFVPTATSERLPNFLQNIPTNAIAAHKTTLFKIFGLAVLLEAVALLTPVLSQIVIDRVMGDRELGLLWLVAGASTALIALMTTTMAIRSLLLAQLRTDICMEWSSKVFGHLVSLPQRFFEQRQLGDVLSRFNAISTIQQTVSNGLVEAALDGVLATGTLAMMFVYSWRLATIAFVACVLYIVARVVSYSRVMEASAKQIAAAANQQGRLIESIRGHQTIKTSNAQALVSARFESVSAELFASQIQTQRQTVALDAVHNLVFGTARVAILCVGASLVVDGAVTVGALVALIAYFAQFSARVGNLVDYASQLRLLVLQRGRLADITGADTESNLEGSLLDPLTHSGLEVCGVSFRHSPTDSWTLQACDLEASPGERVAVIGASGAGKTTLVKLMVGLLEANEGEVRIGGSLATDLGKRRYRAEVATVMQDNEFFSGTIADNICMFSPDATQKQIEEAGRIARIHEDVLAMPLGYRTWLGGLGYTLSAGQRQRVALARALYQKPKILVLDEATCHLDPPTEAAILDAIAAMKITQIIVTHRRESYMRADKVYGLTKGKLIRLALRGEASRLQQSAAPQRPRFTHKEMSCEDSLQTSST